MNLSHLGVSIPHGQSGLEIASMRSVRNWGAGSAVAGLILLGPMVVFLMAIGAEILIDVLIAAGLSVVLCLVTAGAIGWVLLRNTSLHPRRSSEWDLDEEAERPAIAAPPR
jgi:hypothetical protein